MWLRLGVKTMRSLTVRCTSCGWPWRGARRPSHSRKERERADKDHEMVELRLALAKATVSFATVADPISSTPPCPRGPLVLLHYAPLGGICQGAA